VLELVAAMARFGFITLEQPLTFEIGVALLAGEILALALVCFVFALERLL
jgi:hypothetical protein